MHQREHDQKQDKKSYETGLLVSFNNTSPEASRTDFHGMKNRHTCHGLFPFPIFFPKAKQRK